MLSLYVSLLLLSAIFGTLLGANVAVLWLQKKISDRRLLMNRFMGSVFLLFGLLKLVNLTKFVDIFSKYDFVAKHVRCYAVLFPFVEIGIGVSLLTESGLPALYWVILVIMGLNLGAVLLSLARGQKLRCGCLGSFFHLPLSYSSLAENGLMIAMASAALAQP